MTSTKKKFNSKVFTVAIVLVIVLSWIISPLATIGASAATVSGSPTLFSGYGQLEGVYLTAADTNGDEIVNSADYLQIKNYFLGEYNLY